MRDDRLMIDVLRIGINFLYVRHPVHIPAHVPLR